MKPSPLPQLVTGRVAPASSNLTSPVRGAACVYYHVEAQTGEIKNGREEFTKAFEESQCVDFVLADPSHTDFCCAVHGRGQNTTVRVHGVANGSYTQPGSRLDNLWTRDTSTANAATLNALTGRHKFDMAASKRTRIFEYTFDVNEQVVILGIVSERAGPDGKKMNFCTPCTDATLTEEYFQTYGWSESAKKSWHSLFKNGPAILVSDDDVYFQAVRVEAFDADTVPEVLSS